MNSYYSERQIILSEAKQSFWVSKNTQFTLPQENAQVMPMGGGA